MQPIDTPPNGTFGTALRRERERSQLSQARLAKLVCIKTGWRMDHSTISRLESGARVPSRDLIEAIAVTLDLNYQRRFVLYAAAGFLPDPLEEWQAMMLFNWILYSEHAS